MKWTIDKLWEIFNQDRQLLAGFQDHIVVKIGNGSKWGLGYKKTGFFVYTVAREINFESDDDCVKWLQDSKAEILA